jgi:hypothetical protein
MPRRPVEHLPLGLVVEFDRERDQGVRQQSRQGEWVAHGRMIPSRARGTQLLTYWTRHDLAA